MTEHSPRWNWLINNGQIVMNGDSLLICDSALCRHCPYILKCDDVLDKSFEKELREVDEE